MAADDRQVSGEQMKTGGYEANSKFGSLAADFTPALCATST